MITTVMNSAAKAGIVSGAAPADANTTEMVGGMAPPRKAIFFSRVDTVHSVRRPASHLLCKASIFNCPV